jgi:hypothetical protein
VRQQGAVQAVAPQAAASYKVSGCLHIAHKA